MNKLDIVVCCTTEFYTFKKGVFYRAQYEEMYENIFIFVFNPNSKSTGHRFYYKNKPTRIYHDYVEDDFSDYFEDYKITKRRLKLNNIIQL
jgi:hypothetical protein